MSELPKWFNRFLLVKNFLTAKEVQEISLAFTQRKLEIGELISLVEDGALPVYCFELSQEALDLKKLKEKNKDFHFSDVAYNSSYAELDVYLQFDSLFNKETGQYREFTASFKTTDVEALIKQIQGIENPKPTANLETELEAAQAKIAELEKQLEEKQKKLDTQKPAPETSQPASESLYLMLAKAYEYFSKPNPSRNTQAYFYEQAIQEKGIRGLSESTYQKALKEAKKILKEARENKET